MTGATVWQPRHVPSRLTAISRCQSSRLSSSTVAAGRGSIGFEWTPEAALRALLPDRGQRLLAERPYAGLRVRGADEAVARPEAENGGTRLLEEPAELRDDGLRRPRDDLLIANLVFERGTARVRPAAHRVLDERLAVRRRKVARRARPHRMGETGELALHPHELSGIGHRFLFGLRDMAALQVAAILRSPGIPGLGRDRIVQLPDLLGRVDGGAERDVRVALARRPHDGLLAHHARDPHARVRLLQRNRPRVDDPVLVVRALEPDGPHLRPRADGQLVRLLRAR